jgi:FkbM family methyltransferase
MHDAEYKIQKFYQVMRKSQHISAGIGPGRNRTRHSGSNVSCSPGARFSVAQAGQKGNLGLKTVRNLVNVRIDRPQVSGRQGRLCPTDGEAVMALCQICRGERGAWSRFHRSVVAMFPWRLTERFLSALARRHDRLADALFLMSEMYQRAYKNLSYDMKINGEYWLLDRLRAIPARTIFDVGANHGLWSAAASLRFPRAEIHAFEIVPSTYRHLEAAVRDLKNVHPNPFGLFESNGSVEVSVSQNDTISSIFDLSAIGTNRQSQERISCTVRRADEYCLEHNISKGLCRCFR